MAYAIGLPDPRTGRNTQLSLLALLRQSLHSRLAGYEDVNDAEPGQTTFGDSSGTLRGNLVNQGAATVVARLDLQNNAEPINDGTLRMEDNALISGDGSAGVQVVNSGLFIESGDPGTPHTASIQVPFINQVTGTVEVDSGTLQFTNAGSITGASRTDLAFGGTTTSKLRPVRSPLDLAVKFVPEEQASTARLRPAVDPAEGAPVLN